MFYNNYQNGKRQLVSIAVLVVVLLAGVVGAANAKHMSSPDARPEGAYEVEGGSSEFSDGGDPVAIFTDVEGDAWIDNRWMRSLVVRDAPAESGAGSHAEAYPSQEDRLLYKFLVILGLADS